MQSCKIRYDKVIRRQSFMGKTVIIINGSGGVGKDTLCGFAMKHYRCMNTSAIIPIKEMAAMAGWRGEKTDAARKFLSDLKQLTVEYSDYPTRWLMARYREFLQSEAEILFVHIREGSEIKKLTDSVKAEGGRAVTLLIRRGEGRHYGNPSDDNVENYNYDFIYQNDLPLEQAETDFPEFLEREILG